MRMATGAGRGSLVMAANYKLDTISFDGFHRNPNHLQRRLSASNPSWVIRTESNVRKEQRKNPDPPCIVCGGSGRVKCHHCQGRGRTNFVHLAMLPKGEWPKWCRTCGGSGLGFCSRCLGTGEFRDIIGFHFMKMNKDRTQDS
ncbi:protein disulfide isomerase pTAC5, chloroplastic isoform X1 [Macadamia integrifolia]|uniref:protein disulfide isomerase pTAC5, chloroplastic isoform X1 n=1 Tax=Macadamia integrifolia TaxID=60698 RepID=UPI001C52C01F|nr:protein disulfide isomerase pTAC5, chloroplastic isoform X1 [Macadamia integrifolia]